MPKKCHSQLHWWARRWCIEAHPAYSDVGWAKRSVPTNEVESGVKNTFSLLLTIFFATFFSMVATVAIAATESMTLTEFNAQHISEELTTIQQTLLHQNNDYERLTQLLHSIDLLQQDMAHCIEAQKNRLNKINEILNNIDVSKSTQYENMDSYHYFIQNKNDGLSTLMLCNFYNYKLEEVRLSAVYQINHVTKNTLLQKSPLWDNGTAESWPQTTSFSTLTSLIIALAIYLIVFFMIKFGLRADMKKGIKKDPWSRILIVFQGLMFIITLGYVWFVESLIYTDGVLPLHVLNIISITYVVVMIRLLLAYFVNKKQWLPNVLVPTLQKRLLIIATITLMAFTVFTLATTQLMLPVFYKLFITGCITFLNVAYVWVLFPFISHYVMKPYRQIAKYALQLMSFSIIIVAWFGYRNLAILFIPNLITTVVISIILLDVNAFLNRLYRLLNEPGQVWSKKLHDILGIKPNDKLIELYLIKLIGFMPAVAVGIFAIMEIWGSTRYQISNIIMGMHHGVSLLGTTIRPALLIRATTILCVTLLLGRLLATYIIRHNLAADEKHMQIMIRSLLQYISFVIGVLIGLYIAGINLRALVVVAGALSVGIGFGLQSFAKDFISGLMIMFNKPIKIGDYVEVGDRNISDGFIKSIGAFSTQLHTSSQSDVIIPNSEIITKTITNFTFHGNLLKRIKITVKLDKNSDVDHCKQRLLTIAMENPDVLQTPPHQPIVLFELNVLTLWCCINDVNKKDIILSDLNLAIAHAFKDQLMKD